MGSRDAHLPPHHAGFHSERLGACSCPAKPLGPSYAQVGISLALRARMKSPITAEITKQEACFSRASEKKSRRLHGFTGCFSQMPSLTLHNNPVREGVPFSSDRPGQDRQWLPGAHVQVHHLLPYPPRQGRPLRGKALPKGLPWEVILIQCYL